MINDYTILNLLFYCTDAPYDTSMKPCTRFYLIQSNIKENPIENNLLKREFIIKLDKSRVAAVEYEIIGTDTYDLVHSSIPEEYQGLGLGHILAERVFTHLENEQKNVILTCHFLQKCYRENCEKYNLHVIDSHK